MGGFITQFKERRIPDIQVDFQDGSPHPGQEAELYAEVEEVLEAGATALQRLEEYKGCQDVARRAMNDRTEENERTAFVQLNASARDIDSFYKITERVATLVVRLLQSLSTPEEDKKSPVENQQALYKQFARLLDLALRFDQTRMLRPHLSNDFSFFRRLLPRFKHDPDVAVTEDDANSLGMFTADHIPMITTICKKCKPVVEQSPFVVDTLGFLANVSMKIIKTGRVSSPDTQLLLFRTMTGCIVLYDHLSLYGAFNLRRSVILIKSCIHVIKSSTIMEDNQRQPLLNAIRYSTRHFNDDTTPSSVQLMFD